MGKLNYTRHAQCDQTKGLDKEDFDVLVKQDIVKLLNKHGIPVSYEFRHREIGFFEYKKIFYEEWNQEVNNIYFKHLTRAKIKLGLY